VSEWNKAKKSGDVPEKWPLRAVDMNDEYRTKPYKTEAELEKEPYPDGVALVAFLMISETNEAGTREEPKIWSQPSDGTAFHADNIFEPMVVDRIEVEKSGEDDLEPAYNYTVRWSNNKGEDTFVKNIPHRALFFVDEPETGDQFVPTAFRHYIGIPDEVFPKGAWRNRK